jgi:hypothetical protein
VTAWDASINSSHRLIDRSQNSGVNRFTSAENVM